MVKRRRPPELRFGPLQSPSVISRPPGNVVVQMEGRVVVTVAVWMTREVSVTVLVASPTATNRLAEISTPAMTMTEAMAR
jgi:hypothetical protein